MDEPRITRSRPVWSHRLSTDKTIRPLCSRYGCVRGSCGCDPPHFRDYLIYVPPGSLRKSSLLGHQKRRWGDQCNHDRRSTTKTGGGRGPWFYKGAMEDRSTLLARRGERATRCEGGAISTEPCHMVLEQKAIDRRLGVRPVTYLCSVGGRLVAAHTPALIPQLCLTKSHPLDTFDVYRAQATNRLASIGFVDEGQGQIRPTKTSYI